MVALSSMPALLAALGRARRISLESYTVHGPVLRALEGAARRGARVAVRLEGRPFEDAAGHLARENARLARELRAAGAEVTLGHGVHAKEADVDGTLYLDEKNWQSGDIVLRERGAAGITARKHDALAAEARMLRGARSTDGVVVESESFGSANAVYSALESLARAGARPRLLVAARDLHGNARERRALAQLAQAGVAVRICDDSEKLAVAGGRAWLGSANATVAWGKADTTDWGLQTGNGAIVRTVRERLEARWTSARGFR